MEITKSRYLLCLVPQDINLFDALQIVIIALMHLLKRRYNVYFKADNTTHHCYSSVYCILSDHPLQALCARLAQGGWGSCQYCHNLSAFFHEVEWPIKRRGNYWSVYDAHVATLKDSNEGVCGKVGPANEKIKVHGWGQQRHLQYTSTVHGLEEELNKVFKAFPPFPGKQSFANQTQIIQRNPNGKVVVGLTGGEMDSFLQVAELLFKERVSNPQERECWQIHINIVHLLQQESFNANNLKKLKKLTKRWKHLMVKFYGGVAERQ
ncbi:uncharacterized protein ACA1_394520 [Acanthamoeba castellanii str. Neff]|uniref:Uncharacterized protein n=1 Tax=Acanthamoeba castellanii (strain ATCC 30010 / Neff) TaxID=1257118 RepID=L8H2S6_ACACF|nr:uncharacterized protein ACA1_394520 [Acanthamoeba castellanii str. Neff]ELR18686.1 hypothetical protein ACA1_394520 [Acanthamoeba castellanii str. Neff]